MLIEGVKLMVVGMSTVMLFLVLMIFFINLVAKLTRGAASRELDAINLERALALEKRNNAKKIVADDADEDIAVIGAAVAAYEAERFARA
ncbi:OadG family protein [Desulforhopalus singaporensis]|uniref:Sodium pump decarboxylases, gamma subunit n=1 Tax=Desulforhopalus singaporensis TaxID=91360 RepID=A0A1H0KPX1_9BACT|nr:OadG family protein [Desulforhopalus singaporensis]SDO57810.1 sodium pump decarboxylases, gamma subunit [Desulforhopalus singaporensis]